MFFILFPLRLNGAEGNGMNGKRILRFYFSADSLNAAMDNLIERAAFSSRDIYRDGDYYAEKIIAVIEAKRQLSLLWGYLNAVVSGLPERDEQILASYAMMRTGLSKLSPDGEREVRRALIKFVRRAKRGIDRFGAGLKIVDECYALISADSGKGSSR